jgi:protein gp37
MHALLNSADFRTAVAVGVVRAAKENPEWTPSKRPIVPTDEEREPWWPLRNVWLGVSVENQQWANLRVPALLDTPAAVRWVSAEPLLGPVDLTWCDGVNALGPDWVGGRSAGSGCPHPLLDWVVVGGESGHGARPMHPDWSRSLRDRCHRNEIPFLFKQWGEWAPIGPLYEQHDDDGEADDARMDAVTAEVMDGHRVVQLERDGSTPDGHQPGDPRTWLMARVGKKAAGRLLDGRLWDQYPTSAGQAAAATQGVTR